MNEFAICEMELNRSDIIRSYNVNIKSLFDQWNRLLENNILTFDQEYLKDKNGHVGKVIQSLSELLATSIDFFIIFKISSFFNPSLIFSTIIKYINSYFCGGPQKKRKKGRKSRKITRL